MFNGVSTSGASNVIVRVGGSSGFATSGYLGSAGFIINAGATYASSNSTGFKIDNFSSLSNIRHGNLTICSIGSNRWCFNSIIGASDVVGVGYAGGSILLTEILDRVQITTVNGTDTFDDGVINIIYE